MKTEQQKVKEKIDGFLTNFTDKQIYGWTPNSQKDFVSDQVRKGADDVYMDSVRMPLWCPKCKKLMNKKLDNKMYRLHNMCFDCVIEMETEMRALGTWEEYEKNKVKENIRSYIKDTEQQVIEEKKRMESGTTLVDVVNESLASIDYETWKLSDSEIAMYRERMDTLLKEMHEDFEKTFGEKVYGEISVG